MIEPSTTAPAPNCAEYVGSAGMTLPQHIWVAATSPLTTRRPSVTRRPPGGAPPTEPVRAARGCLRAERRADLVSRLERFDKLQVNDIFELGRIGFVLQRARAAGDFQGQFRGFK